MSPSGRYHGPPRALPSGGAVRQEVGGAAIAAAAEAEAEGKDASAQQKGEAEDEETEQPPQRGFPFYLFLTYDIEKDKYSSKKKRILKSKK
jgi:hypothetical protein